MRVTLKFYRIIKNTHEITKDLGVGVLCEGPGKFLILSKSYILIGYTGDPQYFSEKPAYYEENSFSELTVEMDGDNELFHQFVKDMIIWKYNSLFVSRDIYQFDGKTQTGIYHTIGCRDEQEDEDCMGLLETQNWCTLDESSQKKTLQNTVQALQQKYKEALSKDAGLKVVGSTFISTIIDKNKLTTVYVGDSVSFLVVLDKDGEKIRTERLNKNLHNPGENKEFERLLLLNLPQEKAPESNGRLASRHAISRSFGDQIAWDCGMVCDPEIDETTVDIPDGGKAYVIVACDGLTEGDCLNENSIGKIVLANKNKPHQEIAKILAEKAILKGSHDNVSVLVTLMTPDAEQPKYLAIFDGHGGWQVSKMMSQHYHEVLEAEIKKARTQKSAPGQKLGDNPNILLAPLTTKPMISPDLTRETELQTGELRALK